jgi:uncharacterized Rmd1/YagE family protein
MLTQLTDTKIGTRNQPISTDKKEDKIVLPFGNINQWNFSPNALKRFLADAKSYTFH